MAMKDRTGIPLYLFAKAPVPGKVKTRMMPELTPANCAELAELMLQQTLEKVAESWPGQRVLCADPDTRIPVFTKLCHHYGFQVEAQALGDLGDRMESSLKRGIKECGSAAVMGCDTPHISCENLRYLYQKMSNGENVVGPALDGGFYFLGLNRFDPVLFSDIQWGGDEVLEDLQKNARELDMRLCEYQILRDIDNWEDLCWLSTKDARYSHFVARVSGTGIKRDENQ